MFGWKSAAVAAVALLLGMTEVQAQTSTQNLGNAAGGEGAQYGPLGTAEPGAGGTGKPPSYFGTTGSSAGAPPPPQRPDADRPGAGSGQAQRLNRISPGAGAPAGPTRPQFLPRGASDAHQGARLHGDQPNRLAIPQPNRFDDP